MRVFECVSHCTTCYIVLPPVALYNRYGHRETRSREYEEISTDHPQDDLRHGELSKQRLWRVRKEVGTVEHEQHEQ